MFDKNYTDIINEAYKNIKPNKSQEELIIDLCRLMLDADQRNTPRLKDITKCKEGIRVTFENDFGLSIDEPPKYREFVKFLRNVKSLSFYKSGEDILAIEFII